MDAWSQDYVLQLQAMAGNAAVQGLFAQRQPASAPPKASVSESHAFPWVGKIQARDNAALRRDPHKDPNAPHANIAADLEAGTLVEVTGVEKGWLEVEVIDQPSGRPEKGFVSHELVRYVRDGPWEIEMPEEPPLVLSVTDAFLVLKRAEMKRASDPKYSPGDDEGHRIAVATRTLQDAGRYAVDGTSFRVTFVQKPGTKIKIETIEDFVLFAETVEHVYSSAGPKEVASEIRQVWFGGENWATVLASRGIDNVNLEDPKDPINAMFDIDDLKAKGTQKIIKTRFGDVAISHVMAGIDTTLTPRLGDDPGSVRHPKLHKAWALVKDATQGDPRDFVTFTGDIGQAYGEYIMERWHNDVTNKALKDYVADKASPAQFLGDIHGYIAEKVWRNTPSSIDPGGGSLTVSGILRAMYMVDKTGSPAEKTYQAYLEELTGQPGAALRTFIVSRSLGFARIWYVKNLATVRAGHYADQFDEHHEENETSAAADDKLGNVVDSFMKMLADKVK